MALRSFLFLCFRGRFLTEPVLAFDTCDGADAVWQIELVPESPCTEARDASDVYEDDLLVLRGGLVRTGVGSPAVTSESPEPVRFEASDPLPDGVPGALEVDGCLTDAVPGGVSDHAEPEIEDVVFGSNHVIVPDGAHEHLPAGCRDEQSNGGVSLCPPFSCWSDVWAV